MVLDNGEPLSGNDIYQYMYELVNIKTRTLNTSSPLMDMMRCMINKILSMDVIDSSSCEVIDYSLTVGQFIRQLTCFDNINGFLVSEVYSCTIDLYNSMISHLPTDELVNESIPISEFQIVWYNMFLYFGICSFSYLDKRCDIFRKSALDSVDDYVSIYLDHVWRYLLSVSISTDEIKGFVDDAVCGQLLAVLISKV